MNLGCGVGIDLLADGAFSHRVGWRPFRTGSIYFIVQYTVVRILTAFFL